MRRLCAMLLVLLLLHLPSASAYEGLVLSRGSVGTFTLTDQVGEPFDFDSVEEDFVVVAFVFTSCPDVCPVITQTLKAVEQGLPEGLEGKVAFLSITVDPYRDTPERLQAFMELHGVTWPHLTGNVSELEDVWLRFGMNVQAEVVANDGEGGQYAPASASVLYVDQNGTAVEHAFRPSGWNLTVSAADAAGWDFVAEDGPYGHFVTSIEGVTSPEDAAWWWSLEVWNLTSASWEISDVGVDSIDALSQPHLAWVPSNSTVRPQAPSGSASVSVVLPDGEVLRSSMNTTSGHYQTLGALGQAGLDLNISMDPAWGHMMHGIDNTTSPEDWSWWWRLAVWNASSSSWEESQVGMDQLNDTLHMAWSPSNLPLTDLPAPGSLAEAAGETGDGACDGRGYVMGSGAAAHCMCDEGYGWAEGDAMRCLSIEDGVAVGHSTMTFILDEQRKPRIVWTGDGWSPASFTSDLDELARHGNSAISTSPVPAPGMALGLVALFGAALLAERRR